MNTNGSSLPAALVSFLRPVLGIVIVGGLVPLSDSSLLLWLVLAACTSDWLDGEMARRFGTPSKSGRIIDNVCDFAFLLCVFAYCARAEVWSQPVWGQLLRHWAWANWLPVFALLSSFGLYFVRLLRELAAGLEPERSPRGHVAGVSNYLLAIVAGVEMLPGVTLGARLLESLMAAVVLLNVAAVFENAKLMFHRQPGEPKMPS
jgi:phosphatidylglycerophosphate synthase